MDPSQLQALAKRARELDAPALLFSVGTLSGELAAGLLEIVWGEAPGARRPLAYETAHAGSAEIGRRILAARARRGAFTAEDLVARLRKDVYVGVAIQKREIAGKPFADRISIGRARNNDIVVRDESVSKFHAWFDGDMFLNDAGSKNGTFVNDERIERRAPLPLTAGDVIRFGHVASLLCTADILLRAASLLTS